MFALEIGGTDIREFEFPEKGICMIGSEETGLTREARELALSSCGIVTIPQFGAKGSINVASAMLPLENCEEAYRKPRFLPLFHMLPTENA